MPEFKALTVPVHRATTVLYSSARDFLDREERMIDGFSYGLYGNPTTKTLEWQVTELEGGSYSMLMPSGLASIALPLLAYLRSGDHLLVADCVYGPTKEVCRVHLARLGITHSVFPSDAATIEPWLNDRTRLVLLESPGSYSMEIQEIATIATQAREHGALVMMDNTWGFGRIKPFEYGVDIVSTALSKYASGHSDVCMGSCTVADRHLYERLRSFLVAIGNGVSPDDAYLVMRGLQSLEVRLDQHGRRGLEVAAWLTKHSAVEEVLYPALKSDRQYARFNRYFTGANGVVGLTLRERDLKKIESFVDGLKVFKIGASWGGAQSLVALTNVADARSAQRWQRAPWVIRLSVGLEPLATLIEDLDNALTPLI
jgi:cystathionine beta-lyase